jgi:hypothetical protein
MKRAMAEAVMADFWTSTLMEARESGEIPRR